VAALNVKGQTIHKFFHFPVDVTTEKLRSLKIRPRSTSIYKKLDCIIIDEVSMVRADVIDCVDEFLRIYGPVPETPFGGIQMIFVGDLYQLPPVVGKTEKELFVRYYKTPYFFSAHAFQQVGLEMIELEKIYRQKDHQFITLLNRIRNNSVESEDLAYLTERYQPNYIPPKDSLFIHLTTTNQKADEINEAELQALKGKSYEAHASITGDFGKEYYPTAPLLRYKIGAQIMLVNNDPAGRWVNGSMGTIEGIERDEEEQLFLKVTLEEGGDVVEMYPYSWEVFRFSLVESTIVSEPVGTFTQFPFRLAWAVTIHKSQGKTFQRVIIDMARGAFAAGQVYVALSRCTSFEGIILTTPIQKQHIRVDYRIMDFLTTYHYRKSEAAMALPTKMECIQQAIQERALLDMTYLKANDTRSERRVRPLTVGKASYQGKEYIGMRGFCLKAQEERMFRVDRILAFEKVEA